MNDHKRSIKNGLYLKTLLIFVWLPSVGKLMCLIPVFDFRGRVENGRGAFFPLPTLACLVLPKIRSITPQSACCAGYIYKH